jgi:toxin HigB-1
MQIDFEDDDLRRLYEESDFVDRRIGPQLTKAFRRKVGVIVAAVDERDLRALRSLHFEKLVGNRAGQHSIRLNDQWRLILRFETADDGRVVIIIEIVDYH